MSFSLEDLGANTCLASQSKAETDVSHAHSQGPTSRRDADHSQAQGNTPELLRLGKAGEQYLAMKQLLPPPLVRDAFFPEDNPHSRQCCPRRTPPALQ